MGDIQGVKGHPIAEWKKPKEEVETQVKKLRDTVVVIRSKYDLGKM